MTELQPSQLQFRPRARIIRTIGDQLISGPEAAIIELVKNAYDADASRVTIRFVPPLTPGLGRIEVTDDGHGMTLADIQDKWMEPATTAKTTVRMTPAKHRQMMGSKGIGRFAAAKLGREMALNSISDRTGERLEVLIPKLDWALFDGDRYLADISIDYLTQSSEQPTGTTIEITGLAESWSEAKMSRLHLELRRLLSPLDATDADRSFKVYLDLSACTITSSGFDGYALMGATRAGTVGSAARDQFEVEPFPLLTSSDYEAVGSFSADGVFAGTLEIRRGGLPPESISLKVPLAEEEKPCGPFKVHLYIFDREAEAVRRAVSAAGLGTVPANEARRILDSVAGIAIYRSGFRVRPYGDPQNDWLVLDQRRVQNPSLRIGHNQIAGFVTVAGPEESGLIERSSREGFEQGGEFLRLQSLMTELLAKVVEPRRFEFRDTTGIARSKRTSFTEVRRLAELERLRRYVKKLPADERETVSAIIDEQASALAERIDILEDRQRILEAQSSLGQIIAEVLHEGAPSATFVQAAGGRLRRIYINLFQGGEKEATARKEFPEKLAAIEESGTQLQTLFAILRPLAGVRRSPPSYFNGPEVAHGALRIFASHNIEAEVHASNNSFPKLLGYSEDLNTALVNLVGNSVYWLEQASPANPKIDITFATEGKEVIIFVDDNGPGIAPEFAEQVFDVGFTLRNGGTGLGLNIAREALARSGAKLLYHAERPSGARFEIRFPR